MGSDKKRVAKGDAGSTRAKMPCLSASVVSKDVEQLTQNENEDKMMTGKEGNIFPFEKLPGEIRNKIYGYYFQFKHHPDASIFFDGVQGKWFDGRLPRDESGLETSLLRASKTIHREAHPFLFKDQTWTFVMQSLDDTNRFLQRIGLANRARIEFLNLTLNKESAMWDLSSLIFDCSSLYDVQVSAAGAYYWIGKDDLFARLRAGEHPDGGRNVFWSTELCEMVIKMIERREEEDEDEEAEQGDEQDEGSEDEVQAQNKDAGEGSSLDEEMSGADNHQRR